MATKCKLVFGWTTHMDNWEFEKSYIRWYDGYPEAIVPLLKEYKGDVEAINESIKEDSHEFIDNHEFIELESFEFCGVPDFIYYVDKSDLGNIRCTVLGSDLEFYNKYGINNYKVIKEFTL